MKNLKYTVIIFLSLFKNYNAHYYGWTHNRMKFRLISLNRELVLESIRNVERVDHFKELYVNMPGYDVGQVIYDIRSRYARMLRVYTDSYKNIDNYDHNKHIINLSEIQHLAMEVYNLVEVLEEWEDLDIHANRRIKTRITSSQNEIRGLTPKYKQLKSAMKNDQQLRVLRKGEFESPRPANEFRFIANTRKRTTKITMKSSIKSENDGGGFDSEV